MSRFHPFRSLDGLRLRLTVERLSTHALAYLSHPDDIPLLGERRHEPRLMTEAGLDSRWRRVQNFRRAAS